MLIHIGSWGHDPTCPREEYIVSVLVGVISYYEGLSFREMLRECPVVVLFLSDSRSAPLSRPIRWRDARFIGKKSGKPGLAVISAFLSLG